MRTAGVAVGSSLDARHGAHNLPLNTYIKWTKLRPLKFHNTSLRACSRTYRYPRRLNTKHAAFRYTDAAPAPADRPAGRPRDGRDPSAVRTTTRRAPVVPDARPTRLAPRPRPSAKGRRVMRLLRAPGVGLFNRCCPTRSRWATGTRRRSPVWATGAWTEAQRQRRAAAAQAAGRHVGRPA